MYSLNLTIGQQEKLAWQYKPLHGQQPSDLSKHITFHGLSLAYDTQLGHMACMGDRAGACRVLVWRPEEKRAFGRPRHRWKDNIKMDPKEVG